MIHLRLLADFFNSPLGRGINSGTQATDVPRLLITNAINIALWAVGILATVAIIVAGIQLITSAGNPDGIKKARATITWAVGGLALSIMSFAAVNFITASVGKGGGSCASGALVKIDTLCNTPDSVGTIIANFTAILFWVLGIAAVVGVITGGILYVTSAGDSGKSAKAKDAILYSVIGLVISLLGYALINFVVNAIH